MLPSIGRIVYYKSRGSLDGKFPPQVRASIVTDVRLVDDDGSVPEPPCQVRLTVFNPEGLFFTDWLDQGSEGGQWDWMPFQKDQQARLNPSTDDKAQA